MRKHAGMGLSDAPEEEKPPRAGGGGGEGGSDGMAE